jgi:WXXGXW repeat (2 copies)
MITTKGRTMNLLTELKQETPSFRLRKRRSRRVSAPELETKTRSGRVILPLLLLSTLFWAGCEDYYSSSPGYYGPGSYYGGDSFDFLGHDRHYYRGPGYWYGRVYYVWTPGYWAWRTGAGSPARGALPNPGQLVWIHGRYIARGY